MWVGASATDLCLEGASADRATPGRHSAPRPPATPRRIQTPHGRGRHERTVHLALIATADDNLDIVVRTRLSAEPQIDRPTPGHTPPVDGTVHCRGDVLGMRHRSRMPRFVDTGSAPASINRARASRAEIGRADDAAEATTVSAVGRIVVLVNGLPAAGKSTLAPDLAAELDLPLISKDVIKEAHAGVLGSEPLDGLTQREWNGRLGAAASGTMWRLLQASPPGAVLESSWRADVRHLVEAGLLAQGFSVPQKCGATPPNLSSAIASIVGGARRTRFMALSPTKRSGHRWSRTVSRSGSGLSFGSTPPPPLT